MIDDEHRSGSAVAGHTLGLLRELLLEVPPVEQAGQKVVIHEVLEAPRELLPFGDVLHLRDDVQGTADPRHARSDAVTSTQT